MSLRGTSSWSLIVTCAALALLPIVSRAQADTLTAYAVCMDSCTSAQQAGAYDEAFRHVQQAVQHAAEAQDTLQLARAVVRRGVVMQLQGDYTKALNDFYEGLRLIEGRDDEDLLAEIHNNIGSIHHYDKNYQKAWDYYTKSLVLRERSGTLSQKAQLYNNFGALLEDRGRPDSALLFYRRALVVRLAEGKTSWVALTYAHMGSCFDKLQQQDSARHYLHRSLELIEPLDNPALEGRFSISLGLSHLHDGDANAAVRWCGKGLRMADALQSLPIQEKACDCLYQAHRALGQHAPALSMLQRYMAVRDSMFGQQRAKELMRIELLYDFEREQVTDSIARAAEKRTADAAYQQRIDRERLEKRLFLVSAVGILLLAAALWSRLRYMRRSRNAIELERQRSDKLLLNILPKPIAEELKLYGEAKARDVANASILFTDFEDFTPQSERMSAQELVATIDTCFKAFDAIVVRYGLEKIKTIGDAYMCAGGLPDPRSSSARDTVLAALDMQAYMAQHAIERSATGRPAFTMRAGIHTGPVVAGIVGDTKFQYDVWGDTVNIAARMESTGGTGRVNISESTYEEVKREEGLRFTARGMVQVKGKGEMEMYYVERAT